MTGLVSLKRVRVSGFRVHYEDCPKMADHFVQKKSRRIEEKKDFSFDLTRDKNRGTTADIIWANLKYNLETQ